MFLRLMHVTLIAASLATNASATPGVYARAATRDSLAANNMQNKSVEDILADPTLWGKDFPAAVAALPAFNQAGEPQVAVFPNRIVGRTRQRERAQSEPRVTRLEGSLKSTQNIRSRSTKLSDLLNKSRVQLKAEMILFRDDRTFRLAATGASPQFIAPGLKIDDVRRRLGKEEKVTTELLDDGSERQPVILKLHHYAGGAIVFTQSNKSSEVGQVDRVFLNAAGISAAIF